MANIDNKDKKSYTLCTPPYLDICNNNKPYICELASR